MKLRIAINGFGRIGRNILRALYENYYIEQIDIVAINDLGDLSSAAHLLKYDTIHGRFNEDVSIDEGAICVNGDSIFYLNQPDPSRLPWELLNVDYVLECTGRLTTRETAQAHLDAGAKKVIVSAPCKGADATVVHGVNEHTLTPGMSIISNASCTTNCVAPIAKVLNDLVGIEQGSVTTIHAVTNDQNLLDVDHPDIYRSRSATHSIIPTKTGAAEAVGLVLPKLKGKLDGMSVRVPTLNVSLIDFHFLASRETTIDEINFAIKQATRDAIGKVLDYNQEPLVSVDFNHQPASAIFDASQTRVNGRWVKVMAWYDNEWGFSNRMLDNALAIFAVENASPIEQALGAA